MKSKKAARTGRLIKLSTAKNYPKYSKQGG